jgi:hypothetical protein
LHLIFEKAVTKRSTYFLIHRERMVGANSREEGMEAVSEPWTEQRTLYRLVDFIGCPPVIAVSVYPKPGTGIGRTE